MTSINQLEKHYDKLTARERFALIAAAMEKGDRQTMKHLAQTGERKTWRVPVTNGLMEAFEFVASWYMMEQLGYVMTIYFIMGSFEDATQASKIFEITYKEHGLKITPDEVIDRYTRQLLANAEAWRQLCDEYKIDSEVFIKGLPHYDVLQLVILLFDGVAGMTDSAPGADALPSHEDIAYHLDEMRKVIEYKAKDWA